MAGTRTGTPWIYDFGRDTVRQFLVASALFCSTSSTSTACRVDAVASMLYWIIPATPGVVPNVDGGNHNYEARSAS